MAAGPEAGQLDQRLSRGSSRTGPEACEERIGAILAEPKAAASAGRVNHYDVWPVGAATPTGPPAAQARLTAARQLFTRKVRNHSRGRLYVAE